MAGPFKNLGTPSGSPANQKTQTLKVDPAKNDPVINDDPVDEVPDHLPEVPWPAAVATDSKPFKGLK